MDLRSLINKIDEVNQNQPSIKKYIAESVYNTPEMTKHWKRLDEGFFRGYEKYLAEVALTPDQIQNIFKQAAGGAAGSEPAKDPSKLAALVDKVLPTSQAASLEKSLPAPDAGPVQGFEQKAGAAVQNLPGVDTGTKQSLMQLVKAGVKKPETQQLILAAVGAGLGSLISKVGPILSMIPGGGAVASAITGAIVAGGVAVIAAKLRGEDWKSAFKGAIKPALMGGAAAVIGNLATSAVAAVLPGGNGTDSTAAGGANTADIEKGLAADQAFQDSITNKFPPGDGYQYVGDGAGLQIFDASGRKVFTGDIPLKTMDYKTFADLTNNGQMATPGTSSGSISSDPTAAISPALDMNAPAGGGMKNPDGSSMTNAQVKAAADSVAPVAGGDADPNKYYNSLSPDQQKATDDAIVAQAQAAQGTDTTSNQGRLKMNQWRQDVGSPNAVPTTPDTPSDGSYQQAAPLGRDGQPMQQVPMDEPAPSGIRPRLPPGASMSDFSNTSGGDAASQQADWAKGNNPPPDWIKNNTTGQYSPPPDHPGNPDDWAKGINPPPEWEKNSATGKYEPPAGAAPATNTGAAPQGAAMDPEYLKRVVAGEPGRHMISAEKAQAALDWQAQNGGQVQPPKGDWSSGGRAGYPGGLAQYYKDHPGIRENAINKQATLREWLKQDQQGQTIKSVQLNPVFVEGIMDFFKGGKKDAAAAPAGGATPDALNKAWTAAGSPTDSEEVAKILQGAGVPAETVTKIFTDLKIPAPGAAPAAQAADSAASPAQTPAPSSPQGDSTSQASAPAKDAPAPAGTNQPASATPAAAAEPPATPAATQQSKVGVGQINKIIPTLRVRDLTSVQKNVDATLAKRQTTKQPTAEGKYVGIYSKFLGKEI